MTLFYPHWCQPKSHEIKPLLAASRSWPSWPSRRSGSCWWVTSALPFFLREDTGCVSGKIHWKPYWLLPMKYRGFKCDFSIQHFWDLEICSWWICRWPWTKIKVRSHLADVPLKLADIAELFQGRSGKNSAFGWTSDTTCFSLKTSAFDLATLNLNLFSAEGRRDGADWWHLGLPEVHPPSAARHDSTQRHPGTAEGMDGIHEGI